MLLDSSLVILALVFTVVAEPISQPTIEARTATLYSGRSSFSLRSEDGTFDHVKAASHTKRVRAKYRRSLQKIQQRSQNSQSQKRSAFDPVFGGHPPSQGCGLNGQSVCLTEIDDDGVGFIGKLFVGTPRQPFTEIFDTGSFGFIIPGLNCTTCIGAHHFYDPTKSKTSVFLNQNITEVFGSNQSSSEGAVTILEEFKDTVQLGGIKIENVTLDVITTESVGELQSSLFDGVLGLSPVPISDLDDANPVIKAWMQGAISKPQFSIALNGNESELFMGGQNPSRTKGPTEFHAIVSQSIWAIRGGSVSTGKDGVIFSNLITPIDSGTSTIIAPTAAAATFYSKILGSKLVDEINGFYSVPCSSIPHINLSLSWGGRQFPVDPKFLNLGQSGNSSTDCIYGIEGLDFDLGIPGPAENQWIVGDVFMQGIYTTFDFTPEKGSVGFSTLVN